MGGGFIHFSSLPLEVLHAPQVTPNHESQPGRKMGSRLKAHGGDCALQTPFFASGEQDWEPMPADQGGTSQAELADHHKAHTSLHVQTGRSCSQIAWLQACAQATTCPGHPAAAFICSCFKLT